MRAFCSTGLSGISLCRLPTLALSKWSERDLLVSIMQLSQTVMNQSDKNAHNTPTSRTWDTHWQRVARDSSSIQSSLGNVTAKWAVVGWNITASLANWRKVDTHCVVSFCFLLKRLILHPLCIDGFYGSLALSHVEFCFKISLKHKAMAAVRLLPKFVHVTHRHL